MSSAPSHRLQWADVPVRVQAEIAAACGSPVVEAVGQAGGYGPGLAARCGLADGRRVFVKAVSPAQNPDTPDIIRNEAIVAAALPVSAPAPALLHALDDGEWVVLVFEDVNGRLPTNPWRRAELERVLLATAALADITPLGPLATVDEEFGELFDGWQQLAADGPDSVQDMWCRDRLAELVDAEARWIDVARGPHLIHGDVRSDNILLTASGATVFVDWTAACVGAPWFDVVCMAPSIELEGGGAPEGVLAMAGLDHVAPEALLPLVAALAGFFSERGRLPDPPGLPTVRAFQRAQAAVTIQWLQRLWTAL